MLVACHDTKRDNLLDPLIQIIFPTTRSTCCTI